MKKIAHGVKLILQIREDDSNSKIQSPILVTKQKQKHWEVVLRQMGAFKTIRFDANLDDVTGFETTKYLFDFQTKMFLSQNTRRVTSLWQQRQPKKDLNHESIELLRTTTLIKIPNLCNKHWSVNSALFTDTRLG